MKIDETKCIGCGRCIPYCTMGVISLVGGKAVIDEDECVECGECQKAGVCPVDAHVSRNGRCAAWPSRLQTKYREFSAGIGVIPVPRFRGQALVVGVLRR